MVVTCDHDEWIERYKVVWAFWFNRFIYEISLQNANGKWQNELLCLNIWIFECNRIIYGFIVLLVVSIHRIYQSKFDLKVWNNNKIEYHHTNWSVQHCIVVTYSIIYCTLPHCNILMAARWFRYSVFNNGNSHWTCTGPLSSYGI